MRPVDTIAGLSGFERRGAGTDAERRAANWLADQIESGSRAARLEPFWCRPNWALAHAWHVGIGLAGSLLSVGSPRIGGALIVVALLSLIADELFCLSPGRRLTFEHASQNVIGVPRDDRRDDTARLIITANYDAGRAGFAYHDRIRRPVARVRNAVADRAPGWLGWVSIALVWLLAIAVARLDGNRGSAIAVLQLVPTVALVLALALLVELASSDYGPAAGDNGSGAAVALALAAALDTSPPGHVSVELVLQGASDDSALGVRRHLRARRSTLNAGDTIVIGIGSCGSGRPRWWISDGPMMPVRYSPRLRELCAVIAAEERELGARAYRGRGRMPALMARQARLPAIAIGCLDARGLVPGSHRRSDTLQTIDATSVDDAVQFGLMLVDSIDAFLASGAAALAPKPA